MASFNRVILMGNLTRDIELRLLPSGMAVSEFSIAVNDRRKTNEGQWVEETSFFEITLYGRTAEVASEYLSKGSPVFIEGRLKQDTWEKDGQKRSKIKVIGDRMQLIGGRDRAPGDTPVQPSSVREKRFSSNDESYDDHDHAVATPSRSAQPTGKGPGYDEPEIPF